MLSAVDAESQIVYCYAECRNVECHCAECLSTKK
jgi:hypothetical protein